MPISGYTKRYLSKRDISNKELSIILNCTVGHVSDILSGNVEPDFRETAIIRLCANVPKSRLRAILDDANQADEWKSIPGFSKYEASRNGQIRRSADGHGSMPGKVLRPWAMVTGHMRVNVPSDDSRIKSAMVHQLVCLAFHGEAPSPFHIVCHRNDIKTENTPDNLYWGTHQDNADDRVRNMKTRMKPQKPKPLVKAPVKTEGQIRREKKQEMKRRLAELASESGTRTE